MRIFKTPHEFEWDEGNIDKNWLSHNVTNNECEEVFGDENKVQYKDLLHSQYEERFIVIGKTKNDRLLYVVFTKRKRTIRIISARDINQKERKFYEKTT